MFVSMTYVSSARFPFHVMHTKQDVDYPKHVMATDLKWLIEVTYWIFNTNCASLIGSLIVRFFPRLKLTGFTSLWKADYSCDSAVFCVNLVVTLLLKPWPLCDFKDSFRSVIAVRNLDVNRRWIVCVFACLLIVRDAAVL
jgi:hypothetical protein